MVSSSDFNYVNFLLDSPFYFSFDLYLKVLDNLNNKHLEKLKDRYWTLWLFELKNGSKETNFEQFFNKRTNIKEQKSVTRSKEEEQRIIEKYKNVGGIKR